MNLAVFALDAVDAICHTDRALGGEQGAGAHGLPHCHVRIARFVSWAVNSLQRKEKRPLVRPVGVLFGLDWWIGWMPGTGRLGDCGASGAR